MNQAQTIIETLVKNKGQPRAVTSAKKPRGYGDKETRYARALSFLKCYNNNDYAKTEVEDIKEPLNADHQTTRSRLTKQNLQTLEQLNQENSEPEILAQLLEDVPEELHPYVIEEILREFDQLQHSQEFMTRLDATHSQRLKFQSAIQKKKMEIVSENIQTIKKNKSIHKSKKPESAGKLYPINMNDETKTYKYD